VLGSATRALRFGGTRFPRAQKGFGRATGPAEQHVGGGGGAGQLASAPAGRVAPPATTGNLGSPPKSAAEAAAGRSPVPWNRRGRYPMASGLLLPCRPDGADGCRTRRAGPAERTHATGCDLAELQLTTLFSLFRPRGARPTTDRKGVHGRLAGGAGRSRRRRDRADGTGRRRVWAGLGQRKQVVRPLLAEARRRARCPRLCFGGRGGPTSCSGETVANDGPQSEGGGGARRGGRVMGVVAPSAGGPPTRKPTSLRFKARRASLDRTRLLFARRWRRSA